jgi:hypothetical protein
MAAQSPHLRLQGHHQPFPGRGTGTQKGEGEALAAIRGEGKNQGLHLNAKQRQVRGNFELKAEVSLLLKMIFDIGPGLIDSGLGQEMGAH